MSMFKSLQTDDPLFYGHINIQFVLHTEQVKLVRKIIEVLWEYYETPTFVRKVQSFLMLQQLLYTITFYRLSFMTCYICIFDR